MIEPGLHRVVQSRLCDETHLIFDGFRVILSIALYGLGAARTAGG